ncbi:hypothetical protein H696_06365 [Fonticula alba]|uniref:Uncharacterized protein n=1 Tax=Fonticula alba TaxID=691883 RepID=A0A058YYY2_FONAL|nr:hypothetical protein H696_06365 [Fonticula alba]KCV67215.1 hypothetical protein H696_06365 [Fonticula alba]|eukprot:XP_009498380.1 hypothetical protein H696_06365 [Fonticula alba]
MSKGTPSTGRATAVDTALTAAVAAKKAANLVKKERQQLLESRKLESALRARLADKLQTLNALRSKRQTQATLRSLARLATPSGDGGAQVVSSEWEPVQRRPAHPLRARAMVNRARAVAQKKP